jgi:hypothetical protein
MDFTTTTSHDLVASSRADRIGVAASVLCAIHCAITPFLLILAPAFGNIWSHPLSHWIAAAFVVPLAAWMVFRGFRRHRKYWILAAGTSGISLILVGAALPHFAPPPGATGSGPHVSEAEYIPAVPESEWPPVACKIDACCPSLVTDETGASSLHIPPAAAVTTLGGFLLIVTHTGNLCACRKCRICHNHSHHKPRT